MYYGDAPQGAQRWHWGNAAPNSFSSTGDGAHRAETVWSVKEQQELFDTTWLILKNHGVVADCITYQLAMELADKIAALRDRQKENRND